MSEELIQRNLVSAPDHMGTWEYYNIGATSLKSLKTAKIIPNKDYADYEKKKPDALIIKKPNVIAAIEYKQPSELKTPKQIEKAIKQELGTAKALNAKIYIITDGEKTIWINPNTGNRILTDKGEPVTTVFNQHSDECIRLISKILSSIDKDNDILCNPIVVDPLPLARQVWQDLWTVSGATPENCLYTFVEVFIFKYLSDLGVLQGIYSFSNLLNQYGNNNENEILEYYASTVRPKIKQLFPQNLKDHTTIINGTIFVSKDDRAVDGYAVVFKKILDRFEKFGTLENIDYDFKSKLFEIFLKQSISKKNWGQFFTPLKVVRSIVSMADINPGMSICDPACGVGKFLLEPILHDLNRFYKIENGKLIPQIKLSGFDKGFDREEQKTIILAKANMLIYMSSLIRENPGLTKSFAELFNDTFLLQTNSILGTLAHPIKDTYDLILTNPPYVMSGSSNLKEEISKQDDLKKYYSVNAMGIEGLFIEWIVRALKQGGKAFVVVPDGIMNRSNDKRLRDFILEECLIDAVISLPINTFFTTNKKTYILVLTKKIPVLHDGIEVKERQTSNVFTYLCSEIGETRDVYRFDMEQDDLAKAANLFNMFKGAKDFFITEDKRCKLVNIDEFYNGVHWSVERWWTQEERVDLGIENESNVISLDDFIGIVDDAANTLAEYAEPLREIAKKKTKSNYVQVNLSRLFHFPSINGLTKKFINEHSGEIPVYGGKIAEEPIGYIADDLNDVKYFEKCLAWNREGSVGYVFYHDHKFSTNDHHRPMILNSEFSSNIDLMYIRTTLQEILLSSGEFAWSKTASKDKISKLSIPIPIDNNGEFDLQAQKNISAQIEFVSQLKETFNHKRMQIINSNVSIDTSNYSMVHIPLSRILNPTKGRATYTRKYGETHKGDYPVFSASSLTPLTYIDTYDYDGDYLSWSTNGFAGTVTVLKGRFSINGDRGVLIPKIPEIDILYLRYILEPIFRKLAKGRKGDHGEDEFTKLYPSMIENINVPLPVDENGEISVKLQKEIASAYLAVEQYKQEILDKLDAILNQQIKY